jgi:predicted enzyme related to lactoylglutathione lyase
MRGGSLPRSLLSDWCRPWAFSRVELSQRCPHSGFDVAVDLNQVTVSSSDLSRSEEFYSRLGLRLIVRSDHYLRFECPSGASTFSVELQSAPSGTGVTVYFETDQLDALCQRLEGEGLGSTIHPRTCPGCGGRRAYATRTATSCACITPARTGNILLGASPDPRLPSR